MSHKSAGLGLAWLGMARLIQNYTPKIYSKERYGQIFFVYWIPIKRGSCEIDVNCSPVTALVGQFNIFPTSHWLDFYWFFKWSYIILTPQKWQSSIIAEILLLIVFGLKGPGNRGVYISFLEFFFILFSLNSLKGNYCDTWLLITNSLSDKNLCLEFLPYMLLTNQYTGFLKLLYLKNEFMYDIDFLYIINKTIRLVWHS